MSVWDEIVADLNKIKDKLFNRVDVLHTEVEPIIAKVEAAAKADVPVLEKDAETVATEVAGDAESAVENVVGAVEPQAEAAPAPAAEEPAPAAPEAPAAPSA